MKILQKNQKKEIIKSIKENKLIVLKTDTVFGLMAIANQENEKKINQFKKSDINKKVSIIFPDKKTLYNYIKELPEENRKIIEEKLPGKYTFIVKLNKFSNFNREDFGVRVTSNDYLQNIIKESGPLLATSVNITGERPINNINEIIEKFKNSDLIIVEDEEAKSSPSTIIDIREKIKILRK